MTNIWSFLLQTLSVTFVACVLRIVKVTFEEHLSPRWQYGVWSVLALRVLIPMPVGRDGIVPISIGLEVLKERAEKWLGEASAFTDIYHPITMNHVLPVLKGKPVTVTDWLFVVYTAGVVVFALWYFLRYVRLRLLLSCGNAPDFDTEAQLIRVRKQYGLPKCPAVMVEGIDSPFVCGVVKPVLVIPKGEYFDDKVMLHELLHLRYHDGAQSVFWCGLRCLHWCNPFMHMFFNTIGNDMETLCDQRVLELVDGAERRDYGVILLTMANDRYARAVGTTSLSNGGDNIAKRIEAIVRFKKYPKGMGLVSVCIALLLAVPSVMGTAVAYDQSDLNPDSVDHLPRAMALARIERCDTVAGALDTYVKALREENGIYLAMVSPYDQHEELEARMRQNHDDGRYGSKLPAGEQLEFVDHTGDSWFKYGIYNIAEQPDGTYTAWIVIAVQGYADENGELQMLEWNGYKVSGRGRVAFPVEVYESDSWCVREIGERVLYFSQYRITEIEPVRILKKETPYGTLTVEERVNYCVDHASDNGMWFGRQGPYDVLQPDGAYCVINLSTVYTFAPNEEYIGGIGALSAGVKHTPGTKADMLRSWRQLSGVSGGNDGVGSTYVRGYNDKLQLEAFGNCQFEQVKEATLELPYGYEVYIWQNGELLDTVVIAEEDVYEP